MRLKINNLLYILEKLKKLEIPLNSLDEFEKKGDGKKTNPFLNGKKGHLIYLFPLLTKCIVCKEQDIKVLLKEIFDEISKEMNLDQFYE